VGVTGIFALDWALVGVSVFNTILQLWLGLTVLLNTERRTWGVWFMGGGLLAGAAFFISHTAILGQQLFFGNNNDGLNFWWQIGWIPVIVSPFAWYIVILWYVGFWRDTGTRLRKRHRFWLLLVLDIALGLVFLMIFAHPIPSYEQIIQLNLSATPTINGVPILFTVYPIFMILCILLSIDALRHPEPADRLMGDLARGRSRPWLMAAAAVLLAVSVLVAVFLVRIFTAAQTYMSPDISLSVSSRSLAMAELSIDRIAIFDLILESLVGLATLLLGQAVVAYEVFTGKVLPRRGFVRQWYIAILLAGGYAAVIGFSLAIQLRLIYSLLLTALLMVVFYALYSWRSFLERERFMARLRPFVSSQGLMGQLLHSDDEAATNAYTLFQAMCRDVLDTREAHLIPAGELASLVGQPLVYPAGIRASQLPAHLSLNTTEPILSLDTEQYGGLCWAIPLWAERGRIGALLLGTKQGGGLYTQEEIEIARATGERIIDMLAGEQMARRLMTLQRGRLAESRVMDRRTRRTLHDETLPTLHTALLSLSRLPRDNPAVNDAIRSLTQVHQQVADLIHTAHGVQSDNNGTDDLESQLRQMVGGEFGGEFNSISWEVDEPIPSLEQVAREVIIGAVREAVRNAAVHGRGHKAERPLNLTIRTDCQDGFCITVSDDGVGFQSSKGHSAVPVGSGGGLTLHSTMLAIVGGALQVEERAEGGTRVTISYGVMALNGQEPTPANSAIE
jgi:signal transduction histidine kinase